MEVNVATHVVLIQLYIGERDSCHKIGVVATESIMTGECLAVIPREAILSCTNSTVASVVEKEVELQQITSSWVPLLIALAAECSLKVSGIRVRVVNGYHFPILCMIP